MQLAFDLTPMQACAAKAQRGDPEFITKAKEFILRHLAAVKQASGEELTNIARAHGAIPHDDRAFGAVFKSLARQKQIQHVGFCMRSKGHGTAGGRVWGIVA